jgi:CheY-like chemotaxis protein
VRPTLKTILVVEDELLRLFAQLIDIARYGSYKIEAAETGYEAVRKAKTLNPDVIIMDLRLPKMGGIAAIRRIRRFDTSVPIIACTAFPKLRGDALAAGADYYIEKPFDVKNLLRLLDEATEGA